MAGSITYSVFGTVTQVSAMAPTVAIGDLFSFVMSFDLTGLTDSVPGDPTNSDYLLPNASWVATVDGNTASGTVLRGVVDDSSSGIDAVRLFAPSNVPISGGIPGVTTRSVNFTASGPFNLLSSDTLILPALGQFPFNRFTFSIGPSPRISQLSSATSPASRERTQPRRNPRHCCSLAEGYWQRYVGGAGTGDSRSRTSGS